jgi:hypothetical protein
MSEQHKPGDVVKGHILTQTGEWVPVGSLYLQDPAGTSNVGDPSRANARGPSVGRKWAMGFVWIVLAGWLGMGTVLGGATGMLGRLVGGLPQVASIVAGNVLGIGLGVYWFGGWLGKAQARARK